MPLTNRPLHEMPTAEWQRLEDILSQFESAWRNGAQPEIEAYLPSDDLRSAALPELVHAELELRLKAGEAARVEDYLRRFPQLAKDYDFVVGLAVAEYRLRRLREPELKLDEYARRLPDIGPDIASQFHERGASGESCTAASEASQAATPVGSARSKDDTAEEKGASRRQAEADAPGADRNLLFGVLALQMDFVNRDALVRAMNAWVLEKNKPLGQILVEQRALSIADRDILEAVVKRHLHLHGDDASKSLAALRPLSEVQQGLASVADLALHASLCAMAASAEDDPANASTISLGTSTSRGTRFRVLRPHARGGLGEVSVAYDEELHREVALKEIQERHRDHAESRARFLLEAEVTGGLEHPGVVPVYGLGCYPDGRPFYAMRFIRGESLKAAIDRFHGTEAGYQDPGERSVEFRKLLGRFVAVCNAISYAHSRGVLHRDLKPSNIMLGRYGETLVVDWGLAKIHGRSDTAPASGEGTLRPPSAEGSAETQAGSALGTPAYMAPEQA